MCWWCLCQIKRIQTKYTKSQLAVLRNSITKLEATFRKYHSKIYKTLFSSDKLKEKGQRCARELLSLCSHKTKCWKRKRLCHGEMAKTRTGRGTVEFFFLHVPQVAFVPSSTSMWSTSESFHGLHRNNATRLFYLEHRVLISGVRALWAYVFHHWATQVEASRAPSRCKSQSNCEKKTH